MESVDYKKKILKSNYGQYLLLSYLEKELCSELLLSYLEIKLLREKEDFLEEKELLNEFLMYIRKYYTDFNLDSKLTKKLKMFLREEFVKEEILKEKILKEEFVKEEILKEKIIKENVSKEEEVEEDKSKEMK
jgi:hypothetical protein